MAGRHKATAGGDAIRFVLDGEIRTIEAVAPTTTVLNFLREDLGRTGTKEGCAEGDCGACTVVLAELDGDGVRFRAVNSCIQFVPTLDGKELITVESLKGRGRRAASGPAGDGRLPRLAMRLLHAGLRHVAVRAVQDARRRRRAPRSATRCRQSVPLHRLPADRRRGREDVRVRRATAKTGTSTG